ncbi:MAG: nitronate monooxygenase [Rhodospirillaceae bacterium]|nr:nitronate monooxygenase [Rhodospirillaceae bacterium]
MAWTAPESLTDGAARRGAERLDRLWRRGREFLGTRYALMCGAMTWVSERNLVSAISEGGGFGVLACGAMKPDRLAEEIRATQAKTKKPFGVNLIVMHPELDGLVDACLAEKVSHVVLAGGLPSAAVVKKLKDGGAKVMTFLPAAIVAKKLVRSGVDAFITEGAEAGGHIGAVSTSVLAQEILPEVRDVPVFVAGGIGRGEAIASYLEMGAAGCQLGTRFVCATESIAHPKFKQAFIRASARDAMPSQQLDPRFPVIPVRALVNKATERFLETQRDVIDRFNRGELPRDQAQLAIEHFWAGALRRAVVDGDVETGSLMAGQSVGMVTCEQPVAEILEELVGQAICALAARDQIGDA